MFACAPGGSADDGAETSTTDGGDSGSSGSGSTSVASTGADSGSGGSTCSLGQTRCDGPTGIEVCNDVGSWIAEPCPIGNTCVECEDGSDCEADRCVSACDGIADLGTAGCEFIALPALHSVAADDGIVVTNASDGEPANVELIGIEAGLNDEVVLEQTVLDVGESIAWSLGPDDGGESSSFRTGGMFRISSDRPVVAFQQGPAVLNFGNESSLLLPNRLLGTTYVIPSYRPFPQQAAGTGLPTFFDIVGLTDDTVIEWTPPVPTEGAGAFGLVIIDGTGTTELNRYDTARVTASNVFRDIAPIDRDLSGTVVTASNPIWVASGSRCSRVPNDDTVVNGFCDPLQEVLVPVERWGSQAVAAAPPLRENENHHWRVFAGAPETTFTTDPPVLDASNCPPPAELAGDACTLPELGDWIDIVVPNGTSFVVNGEADGRLMVVGYLQARSSTGEEGDELTESGDPAMYQLASTDAFVRRAIATRWPSFAVEYVQIVRAAGAATVFVNGASVQLWTPVGDFEVANVVLVDPTSVIESADAFTATQLGYNDSAIDNPACQSRSGRCASSYAHPVGWAAAEDTP